MGVDLGELLSRKKISFDELSGKAVAVDAYNTLYQFLAIIRGHRGEPLMDRQGRVTSHLSGLLYRNSNLMAMGAKLVYAFDGKPPVEKEMEVKRRMSVREEAVVRYEDALKKGDMKAARTYAQATARIKDQMVADSWRLLDLMGIPWVQAPSEGEAQAAYMAAKGDVWAVASQDHDSLLFGAPRLIRNLTMSGRRKLPGKELYVEVNPELICLDKVLAELGLTREQLVDLGILVGTDYNPDGVKGVGPKSALKMVKTYGRLENILAHVQEARFPTSPEGIKRIFLKPDVTGNYLLKWKTPMVEGVIDFLCGERDFSEDRVRKAMSMVTEAFQKAEKAEKTGTLAKWFVKT